jgi:hypothetical protein
MMNREMQELNTIGVYIIQLHAWHEQLHLHDGSDNCTVHRGIMGSSYEWNLNSMSYTQRHVSSGPCSCWDVAVQWLRASRAQNLARFWLKKLERERGTPRYLVPCLLVSEEKSLHNCMYTCLFVGRDWWYVRDTEIWAYGWVDRCAVVRKHLVAAVERVGI